MANTIYKISYYLYKFHQKAHKCTRIHIQFYEVIQSDNNFPIPKSNTSIFDSYDRRT